MMTMSSHTQQASHWIKQAEKGYEDYRSSWSDKYMIELEIAEISKWLDPTHVALDVGCNNGYSTSRWAPRVRDIKGIDTIPDFIDMANRRKIPNATFSLGDVTHLTEPSNVYDIVISVRTIINVGDWSSQCQALSECVRVLKRGGLLLLSEATLDGWRKLNTFREEWGLRSLPMPEFNQYLSVEEVISYLQSCNHIDTIDFSSSYYIATRVLKPLLCPDNATKPLMEWNLWSSLLPSVGEWGVQKLMVMEKK